MAPVGTIPARQKLGRSTTVRKYLVDVDTSATPGGETPTWTGVFGIQQNTPHFSTATTQDDSDMDGEGYTSQAVTALGWGAELKLIRKTQTSTPDQYDPGQEALRTASLDLDGGCRAYVRIYEYTDENSPAIPGNEGWVTVAWDSDGGDMTALDIASVTLTGSGKPKLVTPSTETVGA